MTKIIGLNLPPEERRDTWTAMLMVKGFLDTCKPQTDYERKVVEQDKKVYNHYLSDYVRH